MASYAYLCTQGCTLLLVRSLSAGPPNEVICENHGDVQLAMVRDYRAEAVGIGSGVRESRSQDIHQHEAMFLPSNRELAAPGDPDGTRAMRDWRDSVAPKDGNKAPHYPGTVEKKVHGFAGRGSKS